MYIQQLRNATIKIRYDGIVFLIDPWLQDKGTGFSAKTVRSEMQGVKCPMNELPEIPSKILEDVNYCLVTHLHFDHFSPDYLPKDLKIIAQDKADADAISTMGFENVKCFESNVIQLDEVIIYKAEAIHGASEAVVKVMGNVCGYIFQSLAEKTLYVAGDTVYCESVKKTICKYNPSAIVLNCCEATNPLGRLIMGLNDVELICYDAPNAIIVASHLDSVNHALITSDDVKKFAKSRKLFQIRVPNNGETIII